MLEAIQTPADLDGLSCEQLDDLAAEMRQAICDQVSKTGGHLAPNLGVVELSIALHRVFDFGHDRLLFDVGHQCYPHKLLTGRYGKLGKLRSRGGMAGFPEPTESDYDLFAVGHAGTAVSTAVGMARGDDLLAGGVGRSDRRTVALVGDASIVNGVALEGLNNAGTLKRQFLVILNDNGMSIAKPQGGMATYFDRIRVSSTFSEIKRAGKKMLDKLPGGSVVEEIYHRGSDMLRTAIASDHLFEHFGFLCIGPIDGHDLPTLIDMLEEVRDIDRPVLLHVKTVKGKGFEFSADDPTKFHSPKPFVVNGCRAELKSSGRSFTSAFADALTDQMKLDDKIVAITAAMPDGTGLSRVARDFPDRVLDTGICESHAMDMAAGMAKAGAKPFFAVYSTFAQRALDQVFQEVSLQNLPVRICMDRAGFVGGDGAVHHGFMDVSMFSALPNLVQLAAIDEPNLRAALGFMARHDASASAIRYPRDNVAELPVQDDPPPFQLGKANLIRAARSTKPDLAILGYGVLAYSALEVAQRLDAEGIDVAVYDARFAKPVDGELIERLIAAGTPILTLEDHATTGGFGHAVLAEAHARSLPTHCVQILGMPQRWIAQDSRPNQLAEVGLDVDAITSAARNYLADCAPCNGRSHVLMDETVPVGKG
ncbi:1-deoxy-D-xylulose-5-phosphate synthase [Mucisphaera calidilacus]|uniref:1-deoxy-D-xylulose-5-phosphate synthase n=1 Tax=Mucisphaera calidilacus TaxID=2527982 RepID=A0A518BZG4_9BACT|nr:1-deoxy-D-xylulose-5-phosphate synthase [Mucisphaera calidilacus]QDU72373.1 1-deoxy-D-xylulose-5-phosphate synthase [Mucisphaera calidilacus]